MDLKQALLEQLSGAAAERIGARNGLDTAQTNGAMDSALTAILSGLQHNVGDVEGASQLDAALNKDHTGSILDDLATAVGDGTTQADGAKILGHIFGGKTGKVTGKVAKDAGVSKSTASDVLGTLAPIVLGQLGKTKQTGGLDVGDIAQEILGQNIGGGSGGLGDVVQSVLSGKNSGIIGLILGILRGFLAKK